MNFLMILTIIISLGLFLVESRELDNKTKQLQFCFFVRKKGVAARFVSKAILQSLSECYRDLK